MSETWLDKMTVEGVPKATFSPVVAFDFDHVRAAIAIVEAAITASREETARAGQEAMARAVRDPSRDVLRDPLFAPLAGAAWDVEMTFPLILRRSIFVATCSHVEHVLKRWCDFLRRTWNLPGQPKQDRETLCHALLRYLYEVAGLAITDFETWPDWRRFDAFWTARNCIVHDGGIVVKPQERAKIALLADVVDIDESGLLLDAPAVVHLLPGACEDAADVAKRLIERLTTAWELDPRSNHLHPDA